MLRTNAGVLATVLKRGSLLAGGRGCSIPILATARLRVESGGLTVSSTDLDSQLDAVATVEHAGPSVEICVSPFRLFTLLRLLPRLDPVELTIDGPDLVVGFNGGRARISTLPASDFPDLVLDETVGPSGEFDCEARAALDRVTPFISDEETRYYLTGVCVTALKGRGVFVATDGHRLGCFNGGATLDHLVAGLDGAKPIVPAKAVRLWLDVTSKGGGLVAFTGGPRCGLAVAGTEEGLRLRAKTIDGVYPDFTRIIPKAHPYSLLLSRASLLRACRLLSALCPGRRGRWVTLSVAAGRAQLSYRSLDSIESAVDIGPVHAPDQEIGIDLGYLLEAIQATRGDTITLRYGEERYHAVVVEGSERGDRESVLIMPLRDAPSARFSAPAYEAAA